jgi:hypothetical protein
MDKVGGSTVFYGKDVRTNANKAEHRTYEDDESFISFARRRPRLSPASISSPASEHSVAVLLDPKAVKIMSNMTNEHENETYRTEEWLV